MTHLLLWLLLYPLVAAGDVAIRVHVTDTDVGTLDKGHAAVFLTGTLLMILMHYV